MLKNKTIKLFLMLCVIFFSLIGVVGCSNDETTKNQEPTMNSNVSETTKKQDSTLNSNVSETNELNNLNDDLEHRTGPSPINKFSFLDFTSFKNYFNNLNMNNYSFVSFNLDNLLSVGTKNYFYDKNYPLNNLIIDFENYSHSIKYEFYSYDNPIGSGIDNTSYKIECYDILLINNCSQYDFDFELVNEKDTVLLFDLLLNNECVMKIKIDMEEKYTSDDVEDIVLLLENNIVIIKGGKK